jgi:hypothetical protein
MQKKTKSIPLIAITLMLASSACLPKRGGGGGDSPSSTSSTGSSNLFSTTSVRTGSSGTSPNTDPIGNYYSHDPLYTITGACRGSVGKVLIEITPQSQSTVQEYTDCTNETFTWSKTFASENFYAVKLTALDSHSQAISSLSSINKTLVYDITSPTAPTFLTPTTTTSYTITDGSSQVTVTGQVLNEVNYLVTGGSERITLTPNPDHLHQDFSYTVSVPQSSTVNTTFTALDYAGNSASSSMSIQSVINIVVPVAANELGGSQVLDGVFIQSTVGLFQGAVVSDHTQLSTGSTGIVGDMQ